MGGEKHKMTKEEAKRMIIKTALVMSEQSGIILLDGDKVMEVIDKIYANS